jgi:hypothetical protein
MPKPPPDKNRPSALEMFTDRVSEQELLSRLMAPYDDAAPLVKNDFITVFYGVGGVGKTTLCKKAMETASKAKSPVVVAMLNLDSDDWSPTRSFAGFLAGLVNQLSQGSISSPLTQVLLLMHSQVDAREHIAKSSSELWAGAIGLLDQATQAIGISGVGLLVQGVQWLKDRKQQADVSRRLRELGLWPDETEGGRVNLPDLEVRLAQAFYEDLKQSAGQGKSLRILLDGFERIQARERRKDCQQLLQKWAGYLAADKDESLIGRVRLLIFGRDKLKWDELYDDHGWLEYYTQHLLEGLGEADALDFIEKYTQWLKDHNQPQAADTVKAHTRAILDAADEGGGEDRRIYPYYLDLAVYMVHDGVKQNKIPDLGRTPGELQEKFFRYLKHEELHLLKILALAEKFDGDLFDALIREHRVTGFAVGTFITMVVDGRSYVVEAGAGFYRFHRLMAKALQDQWLKTNVERQQGADAVRWLLGYFAAKLTGIPRKDWEESLIEKWTHGMAIITSQHESQNQLISFEELEKLLEHEHWEITYPVSLKSQMKIAEERFKLLTESPTCPTITRIKLGRKLADLWLSANKILEAVGLARDLLSDAKQQLGEEDPQTLQCLDLLVECLSEHSQNWATEDYLDNLADMLALIRTGLKLNEKINGIEHHTTLVFMVKILDPRFRTILLSQEEGNSLRAEFFNRAESLFRKVTQNNFDHYTSVRAVLIFAQALFEQEQYQKCIDTLQFILDSKLTKKVKNEYLLIALTMQGAALFKLFCRGDWKTSPSNIESDYETICARMACNDKLIFELSVIVHGLRDSTTIDAGWEWMKTQGPQEAKCDLVEARKIIIASEHVYGKYHSKSIDIIKAASGLEMNPEERRAMLEEIAHRCEVLHGQDSDEFVEAINNLASFLHKNNESDRARTILRQLFENSDFDSRYRIGASGDLYIQITEETNQTEEFDWLYQKFFSKECKKSHLGGGALMREKLARYLAKHGRSTEARALVQTNLGADKELIRIDCLAGVVTDETKECLLMWLNPKRKKSKLRGPSIGLSPLDESFPFLRFDRLIDEILTDADFEPIHDFVRGIRYDEVF